MKAALSSCLDLLKDGRWGGGRMREGLGHRYCSPATGLVWTEGSLLTHSSHGSGKGKRTIPGKLSIIHHLWMCQAGLCPRPHSQALEAKVTYSYQRTQTNKN